VSAHDDLYAELKDEVFLLSEPLFEASKRFLRNRGDFLPHGAMLTAVNEVELTMAVPDGDDLVSSVEVLTLLHKALRIAATERHLRAVAVCEHVHITREGQAQTPAIKVLVEHSRGLCTALYMPYRKTRFGGYSFGDVFAIDATPEVLIGGEDAI
jgi:hypothetical protein